MGETQKRHQKWDAWLFQRYPQREGQNQREPRYPQDIIAAQNVLIPAEGFLQRSQGRLDWKAQNIFRKNV